MNLTETVIDGTLRDDGTLELDQRPNLLPGRVQVILKSAPSSIPPGQSLSQVIDKIQADRRRRGENGRSAEEIEAGLHEGDAEYEKRLIEIRSQTATDRPPTA